VRKPFFRGIKMVQCLSVIIYFTQIFQKFIFKAVGRSFGFVTPPHIDIGVGVSKKIAREAR